MKHIITLLLIVCTVQVMAQKKNNNLRSNILISTNFDSIAVNTYQGKINIIGFHIIDKTGNKVYVEQDTATVRWAGFDTYHYQKAAHKGTHYLQSMLDFPKINFDEPRLIWYKEKWYKPWSIYFQMDKQDGHSYQRVLSGTLVNTIQYMN